jgi:Asp-tRNA(Asn)/Glu-tRNA(Gln) amidotransferase C subunit
MAFINLLDDNLAYQSLKIIGQSLAHIASLREHDELAFRARTQLSVITGHVKEVERYTGTSTAPTTRTHRDLFLDSEELRTIGISLSSLMEEATRLMKDNKLSLEDAKIVLQVSGGQKLLEAQIAA